MKDGFELEIGTDPLISDTDYDQAGDYDEYYNNWNGWYSPLVYEKRYTGLEIARDLTLGAVLGEFGSQDYDSMFYFAGWMLSIPKTIFILSLIIDSCYFMIAFIIII